MAKSLLREKLLTRILDRAFIFGASYRMMLGLSGLGTVLVVLTRLSPEQQGYFYTVNTLSSMGIFVELGLLGLIIVFAGHEWSHLSLDADCQPSGDPDSICRLASLARFGLRWFAAGSMLLALISMIVGETLLSSRPSHGIHWKAPFYAFCLVNSGVMFLSFPQALLEGCHQVSQMYACRLQTLIAGNLAMWLALLAGLGLWALPISGTISVVWVGSFLTIRYRSTLAALFRTRRGAAISWTREILPLQWRGSLNAIFGYITYYTFAPVLFYYHGALLAGQVAVTWTAVEMVSAIAATPIAVATPMFNSLVAVGDRRALDQLTFETGAFAVGLTIAGAISLEVLIIELNIRHFSIARRLLPPLPTAIFLLGVLARQFCTSMTTYVRAHKAEPFVGVGILQSVLFIAGILLLAGPYGAMGMAVVSSGIQALVALPIVTLIYRRYQGLSFLGPASSVGASFSQA